MATGTLSNAITVRVLLRLLSSREGAASRDVSSGRLTMPYSRLFQRIMLLFLLFSIGLLFLGVTGTADDLKALLIVSVIFGAMFAGFSYAFYEMRFVKIEFSEEGLFSLSPSRQERFVPWSRVTEVKYSEAWKWIVFRTDGLGAVRVSVYRDGLDTLMEVVEREVHCVPEATLTLLREKIANPL